MSLVEENLQKSKHDDTVQRIREQESEGQRSFGKAASKHWRATEPPRKHEDSEVVSKRRRKVQVIVWYIESV